MIRRRHRRRHRRRRRFLVAGENDEDDKCAESDGEDDGRSGCCGEKALENQTVETKDRRMGKKADSGDRL